MCLIDFLLEFVIVVNLPLLLNPVTAITIRKISHKPHSGKLMIAPF